MPDRVANDGGWLMRVWSPANYPVFASDSRELTHVMHYVIDVTEAVLLRQWIDEQEIVLAEQLATLDAQRRELLGRRRAMQEAASPLAAMLSTPTAQGNVDGLRRRLGAPHVPDYVLAGGRAEHRGIYMAYHRHDGESIARRVFFDIGWPIPGCHRCGNGLRYRLISGL